MKAIVYRQYGPPDVLHCEEMERPVPGGNEVLVRVCATAANPYDWHFMRGTPYFIRLFAGMRRPKNTQLGVDMAGVVEAVGSNVTAVKPGDAVFGGSDKAFAEFACASESKLAIKPGNVSFEQAASVPIAGVTALQALRDKGKLEAGMRVLINGAAGGVGTFSVQIARAFGANVTGVCSTRNVEMVRSLGADEVIDYTRQDFTKGVNRYDVILDCIGNCSWRELRRALKPRGICVGVGAKTGNWMIGAIAGALLSACTSPFMSRKRVGILAKMSRADLAALGELMKSGKIIPVIDRVYSLDQLPEAIRYLEAGHARGKVVIRVQSS